MRVLLLVLLGERAQCNVSLATCHCEWPSACVSGRRGEEAKGGTRRETRRCRDTTFAGCAPETAIGVSVDEAGF